MPQGYSEDRLIDFTPELHAEAVKIMEQYVKGPLFTPPAEVTDKIKGAFVFPGFGGGANWNGAAFDPDSGMMYIPIRYRPSAIGVTKGDPAKTDQTYVEVNNTTVQGPRGLPLLKPPYSEIIAMNMNTGNVVWRVADGGAPASVRDNPALKGLKLDFDNMGQIDIRPGPLVTKTLLFSGESGTIATSKGAAGFRAYDKTTGKVVWEMNLPTLSTGAPMTYVHNGRQYIVIAVSDPGKPAEMVALTLDGQSDNGAPPSGGVPLSPAPPGAHSTAPAANAIIATPQELAVGQGAYSRVCSACHGANGEGLVGPQLAGRTDFANITRVINQGSGEMPSMAANLSPAEIDAVSKYVVTALGKKPAATR